MSIFEVVVIAIGVAMDAFAVSICKGLSMKKMNWTNALIIGLYFGIFQALMPLIGYFLGESFKSIIVSIDHWIAFILLFIIGFNMIKEAFSEEEKQLNDSVSFKEMVPLAIATSIDALTVGVTFAFFDINILLSITIIGVITFAFSFFGVKAGNILGSKIQKQSEILGGAILIIIGLKILLEHLGII